MCKDPRGTVEPSVCCACEGHPGFGRSERIKKFKTSLQPLQYIVFWKLCGEFRVSSSWTNFVSQFGKYELS